MFFITSKVNIFIYFILHDSYLRDKGALVPLAQLNAMMSEQNLPNKNISII